MPKKDQETIEHLEGLLTKAIQAGKQETSGLVGDLKSDLKVLKSQLLDYIERDDKWKDEFAREIKKNTEFRLQTTGGMLLMKWLIGIFGATSVINFINFISKL